jgi:hypothetical protein
VDYDPEIIKRYREGRAKLLSGDTSGARAQLNELAAEGVPMAHFVLGNVWLYIDEAEYTPDPARAMQH